MNYLGGLIFNPNFQSLFLSPFIGAVMGLALNLFMPRRDQNAAVNVSYVRVVNVFNTVVHNHYHGSSSDEQGVVLLTGVSALLGGAWLYLEHGSAVLGFVTFLAAFIFCGSLSFIARHLTRQQHGDGWLIRVAWPLIVSIAAGAMVWQAWEVVEYLTGAGITFGYFFSQIGSEFFFAVLFQALGIACLTVALCFAAIFLLRQIALGGLTDPEYIYGFRGWIIRRTQISGGPMAFIQTLVVLALAWFLLSGEALELVHSFSSGR